MATNELSRRRFLKLSASGAVVVVVAGVGAYLALQPQPQPPAPVATPKPAPAAPVSSTSTPIPATTSKPSPTLVDKANEEGAVMLYCSYDDSTIKAILEGFMKKYPKIKAEFYRGAAPMVQRYLTEYRAGKHTMDTFLASATYALPALEEGLMAPYNSRETEVFPAGLKDPQGLWTSVQYSVQAIGYNTSLLKGADVPQTYWDLLKPKFKDKISVVSPLTSPHALLISKRKIIGPDRWKEFLDGLKAQNPKSIVGTAAAIALLKQGEILIALWSYTGSISESLQQGAPVDFVRKPNTVLAPPSVVWVYKYAPHPNAARLLYDYVISEEGQSLVNDMGSYVMTRPGIPPKVGLGIGTGEPVKPEYVAAVWPFTQKDVDDIIAEWKSVFPVA